MPIQWKDSVLKKPIFLSMGKKRQKPLKEPLSYNTLLRQLEQLGQAAGYKERLTPYTFRRGAATAIDSKLFTYLL